MKKLLILILLFVGLAGLISLTKRGNDKISEFKWLSGSWKMTTKRGAIVESWTVINDSSMQGGSVFIKNETDSTLLETISLVFRNNKYYYIPVTSRQNDNKPVSFAITSFDRKGFVAENPEHDFPKRITYRLITIDSIHAFIDGGPSMTEKKSDFYYSRIN